VSPLDALSALTQVQLPNTGSLNGAINGALNANPPPGATPLGVGAPVSEGFNNVIQGLEGPEVMQMAAPVVASGGGSSPTTWGHMVQQMVMDVNSKQQNANALVNDVLKGGPTPVHQAMISSEEASLSFEFLAQVRNKVIDAYNTVMQMQV
jgi:flagellar hook-basal body complex protein FliE